MLGINEGKLPTNWGYLYFQVTDQIAMQDMHMKEYATVAHKPRWGADDYDQTLWSDRGKQRVEIVR